MTPLPAALPPLVANLVAQLQQLAGALGTGVLPPGGPADALRNSAATAEAAHTAHRASIPTLEQSWTGAAGDAALLTAHAAQTATADVADRGAAIAQVLGSASADVNSGANRLNGIVQGFVTTAAAAGPELLTPQGQLMILTKAQEDLTAALGVVNDTQTRLTDHATTLGGLAPAPGAVPPPVRLALPPGPVPQQIQGLLAAGDAMLGSIAGGATGVVGDLAKGAQGAVQNAERVLQQALGGPGKPGPGGIRIPDDHALMVDIPGAGSVMAPNPRAAEAVRAALSQLGVPYVWGGNDPRGSAGNSAGGFDCSGLTHWAYQQAGVQLNRTADAQATGQLIGYDPHNAMPGDLVVWTGHVAMYVGNGRMVEAPTFGESVKISPFRTGGSDGDFMGIYRPTV